MPQISKGLLSVVDGAMERLQETVLILFLFMIERQFYIILVKCDPNKRPELSDCLDSVRSFRVVF